MTITTAHLCSGYDGLGMALAQLGPTRTLWHAEIDPDMSSVLARHEPGVRNVGDLIKLCVDDLWRLAPVPDILTAGFPCQPVSGAGRQLAELDPRWLWPFVIDIIRTVRPPAVMLENVTNIVSIRGGAILRGILDDLRAAGYAVRWTVLGACAVGAPHHRHRWYLWAWHVGPFAPAAVRVGRKATCGAPIGRSRQLLPTPIVSDATGPGNTDGRSLDLRTTVARMLPTPAARDGVPRRPPSRDHAQRRMDDPGRSLNLEDAVVLLPTPIARDGAGRGEGSAEFRDARQGRRGSKESPPLGAVVSLLPTPRATDAANGGPNQRGSRGDLAMPSACQPERWGRYAEAVALWERVTGNPAPEPTEPNTRGGRRMSPLLPEWMMGLPPGHLTGTLGRNAAIKGAGNGVVPLQAAAAYRILTA